MSLKFVARSTLLLMAGILVSANVFAGVFRDFDGQSKEISDFAGDGKWRVVMIWASDCHICNQEAHQYVRFHEQHRDKDARVLGISMDGKEKQKEAKEFISRHKLNFPNLIGEPEEVAMHYMKLTGSEWVGTPTFLIYTPNGELVVKQEGAVPVDLIEGFMKSWKPKTATNPDKSS